MKALYKPEEGVYLVPRAPTNSWDLWHQPHIDVLLDRLIADLIVVENVDPDRVYLLGYSAGGDGVYQLAPRLADILAAASMMAGHPNDACAKGLRNIAFMLHVGANDSAYNRNRVAREWAAQLEQLRAEDSEGYVHSAHIHAGCTLTSATPVLSSLSSVASKLFAYYPRQKLRRSLSGWMIAWWTLTVK